MKAQFTLSYIYTEINTDCFLKHKRGRWGGEGGKEIFTCNV